MEIVKNMSEYLTDQLCKEHIILKENKELYEYGFQITIANIVNAIIVVSVGILGAAPVSMLLFYFIFVSLRFFCGGYHAKTYAKCFLLFGLTCTVELFAGRWLSNMNIHILAGTLLFAFAGLGFGIYKWAPIEHENKVLSSSERKQFRRCSQAVYIFWVLMAVILILIKQIHSIGYFSAALSLVTIFMIIEKRR